MPLGCPGAGSLLEVLHRVPAGACSGALSLQPGGPEGSSVSPWRSPQVAGSIQPAAAGGADASVGPSDQQWFSFQIDASAFQQQQQQQQPGDGSYSVRLDIQCAEVAGSSGPVSMHSVLFVRRMCADGDGGSSSSSSQEAAGPARLWQPLRQGLQRLAGRAGSALQPHLALALPSSNAPASSSSSSSDSGGNSIDEPGSAVHTARRRLSQSSPGLVPVTLSPAAADGAIVVDGYSGLARPLNASTQLPLPCGPDGLPPAGTSATSAAATCIRDPLLRTAGSQVALALTLGGGASFPPDALPADAFTIAGNATLVGVTRGADGSTMLAQLRVGGSDPIQIAVAEGALARYGVANALSNTVTIERDTTPPEPVITTPGSVAVTTSTQLFFSISYGEPVLGADPFALFGHNGAKRIDAVLDVGAGRLDVVVYVLDPDQQGDYTVWVNKGTIRDLVGNANTQSAQLTIKYRPKSEGLEGAGIAANVALGTSLALCTAASYASSSLLPFSPGVLGCGALSLVGYAQTFYLTSHLAAQWLPDSYRTVAGTFGWTVGEIGLPWANSYPPSMDPGFAFPAIPVVLTSKGQTVDAALYPVLSPDDVTGKPLITVVGTLAPLPPGSTAGVAVLGTIPFLTPSETQLVGAPPQAVAARALAPAPASTVPSKGNGTSSSFLVTGEELSINGDGNSEAAGIGSSSSSPTPPPSLDVQLPDLTAPPAAAVAARRSAGGRGRRSLLQTAGDGGAEQPAFEGALYVVASRGLQLMSANGQLNTEDVLVAGGAVQRAYDVIDAAGNDGAYPRQYYYDRLARTAFWTSLFAFVVMVGHLCLLGFMMWRHARIPNTLWFPRIETAVCLAILPALAYGASGLFNCSVGDIVLGAVLLALLPCSFLLASFFLIWRWLQNPGLSKRRAIFVLHRDPLAAAIATPTPTASPRGLTSLGTTPPQNGGANAANGATGAAANGAPAANGEDASMEASAGSAGTAGASTAVVESPGDFAARQRAGSFTGFVRSLCGARKLQGDWCGINLDSRFVFKYGPLFEATYGQAMARRRATYEYDPVRGKIDRGALVPMPELATVSWRGKALVEPHHLRSSAQLLAVAKAVMLAAAVSGVDAVDSYIQCCLLILLYGFYAIYLLAVRPYNVALVGFFELVTTLATLAVVGLAMAVMDGRGSNDMTRAIVGTVMLVIQLLGFLAFIAGTWWVSLRALWAAFGLRRRLRIRPTPADRFADVVQQVMAQDPDILERKFFDRWMVRALGVGLYDRPVWRRETEDLRRLLRATTLPKRKVMNMGSVVRRKAVTPSDLPPPGATPPPGAALLETTPGGSGSRGDSGSGGGGTPPGSELGGRPSYVDSEAPARFQSAVSEMQLEQQQPAPQQHDKQQ